MALCGVVRLRAGLTTVRDCEGAWDQKKALSFRHRFTYVLRCLVTYVRPRFLHGASFLVPYVPASHVYGGVRISHVRSIHVYISIYIYIYIDRDTERSTLTVGKPVFSGEIYVPSCTRCVAHTIRRYHDHPSHTVSEYGQRTRRPRSFHPTPVDIYRPLSGGGRIIKRVHTVASRPDFSTLSSRLLFYLI